MIDRSEYPRPQMCRESFINLNGQWDFAFDFSDSGKSRNMQAGNSVDFDKKINVPFCPESRLSGIGYTDFIPAVWYRKEIEVNIHENSTDRYILHFGAADYLTEVFINGQSAGTHKGGYCSFQFEITENLVNGKNVITVNCRDNVRDIHQPTGKQSSKFASEGCFYTRTTGIWQTVWLEKVPQTFIESVKYTPDAANGVVNAEIKINGCCCGKKLKIAAEYDKKAMAEAEVYAAPVINFTLKLSETHLWEVGNGRLYDTTIMLTDGENTLDNITGYFGLRSVSWNKNAVYINGKPVYQRLILDQGFYPDGIYTAPSDYALKNDILLSKSCGFNGARLHQKIFEERFLYHADKEGYIVWAEYPSWGTDFTDSDGLKSVLPEWIEEMNRDFSHPAIVAWCPLNETWDNADNGFKRQDNEVIALIYNVTKALDSTRPTVDTSGNFHAVTDIFDIHNYEQNPEKFRALFEPMANGGEVYNNFPDRQHYEGQPYMLSEFGGTWWSEKAAEAAANGWGYGNAPKSSGEVLERFTGLVGALLENPAICGFCYTQLTDVEQEENGLFTYDRKPKFDTEILKKTVEATAAIEK